MTRKADSCPHCGDDIRPCPCDFGPCDYCGGANPSWCECDTRLAKEYPYIDEFLKESDDEAEERTLDRLFAQQDELWANDFKGKS
jgi:hypothetical protein